MGFPVSAFIHCYFQKLHDQIWLNTPFPTHVVMFNNQRCLPLVRKKGMVPTSTLFFRVVLIYACLITKRSLKWFLWHTQNFPTMLRFGREKNHNGRGSLFMFLWGYNIFQTLSKWNLDLLSYHAVEHSIKIILE